LKISFRFLKRGFVFVLSAEQKFHIYFHLLIYFLSGPVCLCVVGRLSLCVVSCLSLSLCLFICLCLICDRGWGKWIMIYVPQGRRKMDFDHSQLKCMSVYLCMYVHISIFPYFLMLIPTIPCLTFFLLIASIWCLALQSNSCFVSLRESFIYVCLSINSINIPMSNFLFVNCNNLMSILVNCSNLMSSFLIEYFIYVCLAMARDSW